MGMNERIKLLADQAEDYATAEYEKWIPTPDFSGIPNVRKIFNEKFAQLIVLECLALADNTRDGCEQDGEDQQALGADWVGLAIARHFGVEE